MKALLDRINSRLKWYNIFTYIFSFRSRRRSVAVQIHAARYILYCCNPCANDPFAGNVFFGEEKGPATAMADVYIVESNSLFRKILDSNIFPKLAALTVAATTTTVHEALNVADTDQRLRSIIILLQYFSNKCLLNNWAGQIVILIYISQFDEINYCFFIRNYQTIFVKLKKWMF